MSSFWPIEAVAWTFGLISVVAVVAQLKVVLFGWNA